MAAKKSKGTRATPKPATKKKAGGTKKAKGAGRSAAAKARKSKAGPKKSTAAKDAKDSEAAPPKKLTGAAKVAHRLVTDNASAEVAGLGAELLTDSKTAATQAARVLSEVIARKPDMVVPLVDRFVTGVLSKNKRVVQTSADGLPAIAGIAPARVAKHLQRLTSSFEPANDVGRDGLVRTFAALCAASVAYQKRLEPVLTTALGSAEGKTLVTWSMLVLPALKGEPHANARAVVERRLGEIPRAHAQEIADFLGIRLRRRR